MVLGRLGDLYRLTAADLDIVADGETIEQAWAEFLEIVQTHKDAPRVVFDVGPLRHEEMAATLDAPEDEDWAEPVPDSGAET